MESSGPGAPSNGTPRSRARGWRCCCANDGSENARRIAAETIMSFANRMNSSSLCPGFLSQRRARLIFELQRGREIGARTRKQLGILRKLILKDFFLRGNERPVASLRGFRHSRQFEVRVSISRGIERVLEPRASGNAGGIAPVVLDLHQGT